jgi:hypothetical protein
MRSAIYGAAESVADFQTRQAAVKRELNLTCWLMSRMPMSLRSEVKLLKAASISVFSVLLSTTRKFFDESGGFVTCWSSMLVLTAPLTPSLFLNCSVTHADAS